MADFDFESRIVSIPDFPEPGVIFKDITPLFADPDALDAAVDAIAAHFADAGVTKIVAPEARGFMIGAPIACKLGVGFIPARKPGKLPRATVSVSYELEYGTDTLEVHEDAIEPGDRILLIDDLIATGGTLSAVAKLVQQMGAEIAGYGCILELDALKPREVLDPNGTTDIFTLIHVK
ncbi:adenine phosphoribosyltransferase [Collinsella tanakaei]|uniref:adenine phosphoribosyltransferase n=1 Tax=Collinsella tanakaei TaxID=626935 RepID=UPI00195841D1|nr:adenine phosphoribosyltransferase [Collinsella tanakaei]MBM6755869.1 adenine phosphoribosyltransferase [Collinsella tanakaei]